MNLRYLPLIGLIQFMYPAISLADTLKQSVVSPIRSVPTSDIDKAKQYIDENKGKKAWETIQPLLHQNPNFDVLILAAQANAELDNPLVAADFYKKARAVAKTDMQRHVADMGIQKMTSWSLSLRQKKPTHNIHKKQPIPVRNPIIDSVRTYIDNDNGKQALQLLKPLLDHHPSYLVWMLTAQSYAEINRPGKSLDYYLLAHQAAATKPEVRASEFGIAKMQFWLGYYYRAEHTYEQILKQKPGKTDSELALAGKVKSFAYMDRPIRAYKSIPNNLVFTTPNMVVAAAQSALWSDWADISYDLVKKYEPILKKMPANSPLSKDLKDMVWQINQAVWPNSINPSGFFSADSEDFRVNRGWVDYSHYWSQKNKTYVGSRYTHYSQYQYKLDAESLYLRQDWRPTRQLFVRGQIEPTNFQGWQPVFGLGTINYQPNDYIRLKAGGLREVVETFPAFEQHITDSQVYAGIALKPLPYIQLDGALNKLNFSDNNDRNGYYVSASALVLPRWGVSFIAQKRSYKDKFVSPYYFSPNYYDTNTAILRLSSKTNSVWHYYIDGGLGNQLVQVTGTPSNYVPTHQWGIGLTGPITNWLILNAYYSTTNQASSFRNTPHYNYQSGGVSLNILL